MNSPQRSAEIVRLYTSGESIRAVGARLQVSTTTVQRVLKASGTPRRARGPVRGARCSPQRRAAILAAYRAGERINDIRVRFRVGDQVICDIAEEAGEPRRRRGMRVVDWDQVAALDGQGWPADAIAELVGTTERDVQRILAESAGDDGEAEADGGAPAR